MTLKKRGLGRGLEALLVDVPAKDRKDTAKTDAKPVEQRREQSPSITSKPEIYPLERKEQLPGKSQGSVAAEKQPKPAPATVEKVNEQATIAAALIKNVQRENHNLLEEAESLISLLDEFELMVRRFEID
ncbi:hypothetical protein [Methylobacter marinus]|uniref:hypothetical protein n=1 Tax=Methylobacter marinus TaxID=34058 RepID=UPI00037A7D02|nr:hypothetical protein [Methylobacter marinus]